jgi:uncharacterized protein involved in outer membrane biogenesis
MAKRSIFKTLLYLGLGFFILLLAVAVSVPLWFKADRFRPMIEKQLSDKLHRPVKLGELGLRVLPMPTLTVASVDIADDPEFGPQPLFSSKSAGIRVHLMPLLKKQVLIDSVSLSDGVLNLKRDKNNKLNLTRLTDALNEAAPAGTAPAAAGGGWTVAVEIASLQLRHFIINHEEAGRTPVSVPVELSLSGFGQRSTSMALKVQQTEISFSGRLDGKGLKGDFSAKPLQFQDLQPLLRIAGTELPAGLTSKGSLSVKGSADLQYDHLDTAVIEGSAEMKEGEVGLDSFTAPLTAVNFTADVKRDLIDVKGLSLKFLQSQLGGDVKVKNWLTRPEISFNLKSDRLEIGEIAAHLKSAAPARQTAAITATSATKAAGNDSPLTAAGSLEVAQGGYNDIRFTQLKGRVEPVTLAGTAGGDDVYSGNFSLGAGQIQDAPGADPLLSFKQAALRLQFWPLSANNISIEEISLDDAVLNLRRDAKQRLNLSVWLDRQGGEKSGGKSAAASSGPGVKIKLAKVNRMMLRAFLSATPVELPMTLTLSRFGEPGTELDGTLGASKLHFNGQIDSDRLQGVFRLDPLVMADIATVLKLADTALPSALSGGTLTAGGSLDVPFANPDNAQYKLNADLRGGTIALEMLTAPLTGVSLSATLTRDAINLSQMSFGLLKTHLDGQAAVLDWRREPALSFSLNADQLEIGDLIKLVKSGPSAGGSSGGASGSSHFTANGNLSVANGGFGVFRFSDFHSQLQITPGLVHLNSIRAQFFSGTLTADAKVMTQTGRFSFGSQLNGLDLASFMKAVAGSPLMTGTADAAANGEGPLASWETFTGYAKLNAHNGQISHFDLIDKINKAFSLTGLSQVGDKDLHYDSLTSDLKFGGGGAHTDNILLTSPITQVNGSGDIKFTNRMDIRGTSHITQSRSAEMVHKIAELGNILDKENRLMIPFTASGPADNPSVNVDAGALLAQAGKAAVKKQAGDFLGGLLGGGKKKKSAP